MSPRTNEGNEINTNANFSANANNNNNYFSSSPFYNFNK